MKATARRLAIRIFAFAALAGMACTLPAGVAAADATDAAAAGDPIICLRVLGRQVCI